MSLENIYICVKSHNLFSNEVGKSVSPYVEEWSWDPISYLCKNQSSLCMIWNSGRGQIKENSWKHSQSQDFSGMDFKSLGNKAKSWNEFSWN